MATLPSAVTEEEVAAEADVRAPYVPEGFEAVEDFLREAREEYQADIDYDYDNRAAALDDLAFTAGTQWDPEVLRRRLGKPCLTIDTLPQVIGQVVGDRRINQTSIKVMPREGGDVDVASIRADLIRAIEGKSRAERTYNQSFGCAVTCGIGNFRIVLDYSDDEAFDQDIFIRPIANPLAVVWDRMSVDPTGRDALHCFVQDTIPRKAFERLWPKDKPSDVGGDIATSCQAGGWYSNDTVRVTEYWRLLRRPRKLAMMRDGKTIDVTDLQPPEYVPNLLLDDQQRPRIRVAQRPYVQMHLITGHAILEGPYELPISRLPVIRVMGREEFVGEDRVRYGIVRFAKDPSRLRNYSASVAAETLAFQPKAKWVAEDAAVEGYQKEWRESHTSDDPLLRYKKGQQMPIRVNPQEYPAALMQDVAAQSQIIKDVTGIHDASLGIRSNETSGKAINARQREGDVAVAIYHDNMNEAILEGGSIINQLIPICYDTARTARLVGEDGEARLQRINDPLDPKAVDLSVGAYDVAITTGPNYTTKRVEANEGMTELMRSNPAAAAVIADLFVRGQDWPMADKAAERLKRTIPEQVLGDDEREDAEQGGQPNPEQQAAEEQKRMVQEQQDKAMQLAEQEAQIGLRKAEAEAVTAEANARKAIADAEKAETQAQQAETELHGGIARTLNDLDGDGLPDAPAAQQPGNAPRRADRPRKRKP